MSQNPFAPFGIVRTADLVCHGWSRQQIARKVSAGTWSRPTRGWIGDGSAELVVETAVRAGAAVSCVSALRRYGVWVPPDSTVHLRYSEHHLRNRTGETRSCAPAGRSLPVTRPVDGLRLSVESAAGCLRDEELIAVLDSVLNKRLVTTTDLRQWLRRYPRTVRRAAERCDRAAESGTESLVRVRLRSRRLEVRTQVTIDGVGRVDLLVGARLVIEVDSKEHHTSAAAYANDRARDRRLRTLGFTVVRLTYEEVMYRWAEVEQDILVMVRRGDHRWPSRG